MCNEKSVTRRKVMKWVVAGIGVTTGGVIGLPSIFATLSPVIRREKRETWRPLGDFSKYPIGEITSVKVRTRLETLLWSPSETVRVYVWRKGPEEIVVYSMSCTDLGCPVNYDAGSQCFFCPCHGGIFSIEGERMAGPPKLPLYRYTSRILDGFLEIDLSSVPVVA